MPKPSESGTLWEFIRYFLRLGTFGFGGPIVLAGHMQRDLVDEKKWITKDDYVEGLALAQLAPGPLAAQLAIYLGWVKAGVLGATLVGIAFILPSFLIVLGISALYIRYEGLSWIQGVFYGVGAAVIAVIVQSAVKLVKRTFAKDKLLWALGLLSAGITVITESELLWVFLLSGVVAVVVRSFPPKAQGSLSVWVLPAWLVTGLHGETGTDTWSRVFLYFAKAGAFVFGSGLAIVPFLHGGVVQEHHWLTERQFIDAVAVAMITPGPVVITVAFIGYLVAGPLGAALAALGVFLPCYLLVVFPAPYYRRFAKNKQIKSFVDGVTAAAIGAIVGAAVVLGKRAIVDIPTAVLCLSTLVLLVKAKNIPEPLLILGAGVAGFLLRH